MVGFWGRGKAVFDEAKEIAETDGDGEVDCGVVVQSQVAHGKADPGAGDGTEETADKHAPGVGPAAEHAQEEDRQQRAAQAVDKTVGDGEDAAQTTDLGGGQGGDDAEDESGQVAPAEFPVGGGRRGEALGGDEFKSCM